jgi:hypothetical protein
VHLVGNSLWNDAGCGSKTGWFCKKSPVCGAGGYYKPGNSYCIDCPLGTYQPFIANPGGTSTCVRVRISFMLTSLEI